MEGNDYCFFFICSFLPCNLACTMTIDFLLMWKVDGIENESSHFKLNSCLLPVLCLFSLVVG